MKKIFFVSACIVFSINMDAQNVGINDLTPTAKLTVKGFENTLDGQGAAIKLQNIAGNTNAWFLRAGGTGNNTPNGGFSIADNLGYHFNMSLGGNIGLGIAPSTAKLHLNGTMKIEGLNTLEFGAGLSKELNAGKIGYQTFTPGALDIVGAGTTVATRKVNIFAEGGTTFNGPINVGGSTGIAGQVLTSNGTASPTWTNTAQSNDVRFEVFSFVNSSSLLDPGFAFATRYNLNPAAVSISGGTVTINRSGLYHIEGYITTEYFFASTPSFLVNSSYVNIDGRAYTQSFIEGTNRDFSYTSGGLPGYRYVKSIRFVQEVYIGAPGNINLTVNTILQTTANIFDHTVQSGVISGYLISD